MPRAAVRSAAITSSSTSRNAESAVASTSSRRFLRATRTRSCPSRARCLANASPMPDAGRWRTRPTRRAARCIWSAIAWAASSRGPPAGPDRVRRRPRLSLSGHPRPPMDSPSGQARPATGGQQPRRARAAGMLQRLLWLPHGKRNAPALPVINCARRHLHEKRRRGRLAAVCDRRSGQQCRGLRYACRARLPPGRLPPHRALASGRTRKGKHGAEVRVSGRATFGLVLITETQSGISRSGRRVEKLAPNRLVVRAAPARTPDLCRLPPLPRHGRAR